MADGATRCATNESTASKAGESIDGLRDDRNAEQASKRIDDKPAQNTSESTASHPDAYSLKLVFGK